jgi:restriction endonuclease Mrr
VPPLTRDEVKDNEVLHQFSPFLGVQGTNFIIDNTAIPTELEKAIARRRVPISGKPLSAPFVHIEKVLDDAIKDANAEVKGKLREHLANMDYNAFEWLARRLFDKLGYHGVTVTKRGGDGGIDVKAILVDGGVAKIPTRIQVKYQKNPVGRPVVQNLRGPLHQGETGVLLTLNSFSDEACLESKDRTTMPITLIDGRTLVDLLIKHQIGVRRLPVTLYGLELNDLTMERLQSAVEEIDESGQVEP